MEEVKRIYILLLHNSGLKIKDIAKELDLDKYYVADILFSTDNIPFWYQDSSSLWFAKEGAIEIDEPVVDKLIEPVSEPIKINTTRFCSDTTNDSVKTYISELANYRVYSNQEILELFKRYQNGDRKAYDLIVKSNLKLVVGIAFLYRDKGILLEDLIQEGNRGLLKAIERFDDKKSMSFSNFAKGWILQFISNSFYWMPYTVRFPLNMITQYRRVRKIIDNFEQEHDYPPSYIEIESIEMANSDKISFLTQLPDSLLDVTNTTNDLDIYPSYDLETDHFLIQEHNKFLVNKLLRRLRGITPQIIRKYYGIDMTEETLYSLAEYFNCSRERVRQIVGDGIKSMREASGIRPEKTKIGDYIKTQQSQEIGKVINMKPLKDGSTVLVVKMEKGNHNEFIADDTVYSVMKKKPKGMSQERVSFLNKGDAELAGKDSENQTRRTENEIEKRKEVQEYKDIKVGDYIIYHSKYCLVSKIIIGSRLPKLTIKYDNGVYDVITYGKGYSKINNHPQKTKRTVSTKVGEYNIIGRHIKEYAKIGDRIIYEGKRCTVIDRTIENSSYRLIVKYEGGKIDNVLNDREKYKVLKKYKQKL